MRIDKRDAARLSVVAMAFLLIAFETPSGFAQSAKDTTSGAGVDHRRDIPPSNPPEVILAEPPDPSRLFDELVTIKVKGVLLNVPWGYVQDWPLQQLRGHVSEWEKMGFTFWMPDRRYIRFNPNSYPGAYRPPEPGRSEPGPDAYVVGVSNLRQAKLDDPGYVSPEQGFRNSTSSPPSVGSFFFQDEPFDLVQFGIQDWPYISPAWSTEYRHKEGTEYIPGPQYGPSSGYGPRSAPKPGASKFHHALDFRAPAGTPIPAAAPAAISVLAFAPMAPAKEH